MKDTFNISKDYIIEGIYLKKGSKLSLVEEVEIGSEESREELELKAQPLIDLAIENNIIEENDFDKIEKITDFYITKYLENPQNVPTLEDVKKLISEIDDCDAIRNEFID